MRRRLPRASQRNGFALIAVLWLAVALSVLLSVGLVPVRLGSAAAENRLAGARAVWAARACVALLQARHRDGGSTDLDEPIDLGTSTWCTVDTLPWDERINPNVLDSAALFRVLADTIRVSGILDWIDSDDVARSAGAEREWYGSRARMLPRNARIKAVDEIAHIRGFEAWSIEGLEGLFTIAGDGSVSPDRASGRVLRSIGALSDADVTRLVAMRDARKPFTSPEAVSLALDLEPTIDEFRELTMRLSIRPRSRLFRVQGWSEAGLRTIRSRMDVTLTTHNDGLVISELSMR